jgi:hypothetical protein
MSVFSAENLYPLKRNKDFFYYICLVSFFYGSTALVGLGLLLCEVPRSHSVGLLWTSDRPVAKTSTWQRTTLARDIHAPAGFELTIPASKRPLGSELHYNFCPFNVLVVQFGKYTHWFQRGKLKYKVYNPIHQRHRKSGKCYQRISRWTQNAWSCRLVNNILKQQLENCTVIA